MQFYVCSSCLYRWQIFISRPFSGFDEHPNFTPCKFCPVCGADSPILERFNKNEESFKLWSKRLNLPIQSIKQLHDMYKPFGRYADNSNFEEWLKEMRT